MTKEETEAVDSCEALANTLALNAGVTIAEHDCGELARHIHTVLSLAKRQGEGSVTE